MGQGGIVCPLREFERSSAGGKTTLSSTGTAWADEEDKSDHFGGCIVEKAVMTTEGAKSGAREIPSLRTAAFQLCAISSVVLKAGATVHQESRQLFCSTHFATILDILGQ